MRTFDVKVVVYGGSQKQKGTIKQLNVKKLGLKIEYQENLVKKQVQINTQIYTQTKIQKEQFMV